MPVRLGNACARSAIAPAICGAANEVPDHRNGVPVSSGARTRSPTAVRNCAEPVPARSLNDEITSPEPIEPAMMTSPRDTDASLATLAKASGLGVPSLPAAMTTMIPAAVARPIAARSVAVISDPPSDMLTTRAPAVRAASTPRAIASVPKRQALSLSLVDPDAQLPGRSARSATTVASNAMPCEPAPLRRPAAVKATAVPCPSSSSTEALPATDCDCAEMRLPNSSLCRSMPLSMMPIATPAPVAARLYAASAFIDTAPTVARYSAVSLLAVEVGVGEGEGAGVGAGVGVGVGVGVGSDAIGGGGVLDTPPPPPHPASSSRFAKPSPRRPIDRRITAALT